jgi:hypothetical protein
MPHLLDIDYVNHEDPSEAYRDPVLCFETLEPVYRAAEAWFHSYGLRPLVIMTRQGTASPGASPRARRDVLVSMGRIGERESQVSPAHSRGRIPCSGRAHETIGDFWNMRASRHRDAARAGFDVPVKLADVRHGGGRFSAWI